MQLKHLSRGSLGRDKRIIWWEEQQHTSSRLLGFIWIIVGFFIFVIWRFRIEKWVRIYFNDQQRQLDAGRVLLRDHVSQQTANRWTPPLAADDHVAELHILRLVVLSSTGSECLLLAKRELVGVLLDGSREVTEIRVVDQTGSTLNTYLITFTICLSSWPHCHCTFTRNSGNAIASCPDGRWPDVGDGLHTRPTANCVWLDCSWPCATEKTLNEIPIWSRNYKSLPILD